MASSWFVKYGDQLLGPLKSSQLKLMVAQGKIVDDTQIAKARGGPFFLAGTLKGLFNGTPASSSDKQVEYSEKKGSEMFTESQQTLKVIPQIKRFVVKSKSELVDEAQNKHPLLALWSLAISSGLLVASLLYAVAWKFSAPVWAYGTALVPIAIMLLIISWYAYRSTPTRLNGTSFLVNMVFTAVTLTAGLGSIYDMWKVDAQMKKSMNEMNYVTPRK